ncbi:MAG TPA: serine/threonine-protein kinase [Vicinamibacterales bacterium]|nr:serine/threonine-protein kinase [Vicinamibacterales bacterium]
MQLAEPHLRSISHYEILAPLGRGGMGEVYVAFDTTLQRKVALKAVRQDRRLDDEARARLLREARILSQLDHPGICRVYDYVVGDGSDYLVLELIEGRTLRDAVAGPIDRAARLRIAEQVAQALAVAHAAGIVHRDLKPENVMLLPDGTAKVLDFGLARSFDAGAAAAGAGAVRVVLPAQLDGTSETMAGGLSNAGSPVETVLGTLMGTPQYMSPEQASGEPATTASDMYAFGILLHELLTGRPAYERAGDLAALLRRVQRAETVAPVGVGRDLADLIGRLTAAAPSRRPTAVETVERLRRVIDKPRRRLRAAAIVALLLVAVAGGIKYTVDLAHERTAAIAAREEATRRRDQAEGLIGFMLGDLRSKLQRVGRLDVLDDVGQRAMAYFAAVPPESLSDEELFRRSQAVHQMGQVRMAQADLAGAAALFEQSLQLIAGLTARNPQHAEWQVGLATSHFYVGDALRLQGNLAGAMSHFTAYRDIASRLVARDPSRPEWLLELSYGHSNVAAVLEAMTDLEGARRELTASLEIKRRLAAEQPERVDWQEALANGHSRLATLLENLGEASEALTHHLDDFRIRQALLARHPADAEAQRKLAIAASYVGLLYRDQGDDARAMEFHRLRLDTMERLAARDPSNADWQRDLGIAGTRMATLQRLRGELREAAGRAERAEAVLRRLADADPTHLRRQRDAADAAVELAAVRLETSPEFARVQASGAVVRLEAVIRRNPRDIDARRLLAEAHLLAAEASRRTGAVEGARQSLLRGLAVLDEIAPSVKERRLQKTRATILRRLGRTPEADAVTADLRASGFRRFIP